MCGDGKMERGPGEVHASKSTGQSKRVEGHLIV